MTEPLLSGLCVLFKCFEIKPFYHVKSLVALVSSSGLKAILFLPLVFDLRFKSARPPCAGADLRAGSSAVGKAWRGLQAAQLIQGTASDLCRSGKDRNGRVELALLRASALLPSPFSPRSFPLFTPTLPLRPLRSVLCPCLSSFSHPFRFPSLLSLSLPLRLANCQQMTSPFMFGAERRL